MDNLSAEMIQCKKDGFGCHYGKWKALQAVAPVKAEPQTPVLDDGRKVCEGCGSEFYYYRRKKAERMAANG